MILLDTNVVSEFMKPEPSETVGDWLDAQQADALYLSSITMAELRYGAALVPEGRRRRQLETAINTVVRQDFEGRVLPFDDLAAECYARIRALRRARGAPVGAMDAMIAAIAFAREATLATRNVRDFEGCGIEVIDPFSAG